MSAATDSLEVIAAAVAELDPLVAEDYDARDEFPQEWVDLLTDLGLPAHYVPVSAGGALESYQRTGGLIRSIAALDLALAIAHGKTYLGAVSVWVGGTAEQQRAVGKIIQEGHPVSWGLTERDHGSDLLAGDVVAEPVTENGVPGYRLAGEKWLINNATRGTALCVLARTDASGGPRGYSMIFVDKRAAAPGSITPLPKELTMGIRGADISGVRFDGAFVPAENVIGGVGKGLEIVLKAMQITRSMCGFLSLGASDHCLRIAAAFAKDRVLYGKPMLSLPGARKTAAEAVAAHLLAESAAVAVSRLLHTLPGEMTVLAASVKYLLPALFEEQQLALRRLTGARSLVAGSMAEGTLAKVERDHRLISVFDGNAMVNLTTLVTQFSTTLWREGPAKPAAVEAMRQACDLSGELSEPDLSPLTLVARHGLTVLRELEAADADAACGRLSAEAAADVAAGIEAIKAEIAELRASTRQIPRHPVHIPEASLHAAARLAVCVAASAAVAVWVNSAETAAQDNLWRDGAWLRLALHAATARLDRAVPLAPELADLAVAVFAEAAGGARITIEGAHR